MLRDYVQAVVVRYSDIDYRRGIAAVSYTQLDVYKRQAFGDGDNDLEMMDFASFGVAMDNGTPALRAAADMVTDEDVYKRQR